MRKKRIFWAVIVTALIFIAILLLMEAYYIVIALFVAALLLGHRELWHLLKGERPPAIDERMRHNALRAVRNGFVFFALAATFLVLVFGMANNSRAEVEYVVSGLLLATGMVYLLSYLFYDRAGPSLDERWSRMLSRSLALAGMAAGAFIISVVLHNLISALFNVEEPVFFIIAVIVSPLAFALGLIGSLVIFIKGLVTRPAGAREEGYPPRDTTSPTREGGEG